MNVLIADDEEIVHKTIGDYLRDSGHAVISAHDGATALEMIESMPLDMALVDACMPEMDGLTMLEHAARLRPDLPMVIITGHGSMEMAVQALRAGATDFLCKPIKLLYLDSLIEKSCGTVSPRLNRDSEPPLKSASFVVGKSKSTNHMCEQIDLAVQAGCDTILVTGETGTGKEVVAREIHRLGNSGQDPFVAVSCPAIPDTLIESELFGHERGSYTGAAEKRIGCFELAADGTLLLDEVGDLSPAAQAKLLRALETRSFRRVGGGKEISVQLRVIAATNLNLEASVEAGKFRADLFYRLNVFAIHLAPLKQRREDIVPMANYFLWGIAEQREGTRPSISEEAIALLEDYDYPGNVRELRNIVERAAIAAKFETILPRHLNIKKTKNRFQSTDSIPAGEEHERTTVLDALEKSKWNRRQAAKLLEISYSGLRYKLTKLGIS